MAKLSSLTSCFLLSICLLVVTATSQLTCDNNTSNGVRGMIIFGDDIVDNGNNNGIVGCYIKSDYLPYGVDFPYGPTGRFSNGKTIADCVADNLKLPYYPPPYPDSSHQGVPLLKGVNFGSAGTGIFSITGSVIIGIKHMDEQLDNFQNDILPKLKEMIGCSAQVLLPQYLFMIGTGNNDYTSYYILKQHLILSPEVFASKLVKRYFEYLQKLYDMGARKFLLVAPYPVGCDPGIVLEHKGCIQFLNDAIDIFHDELMSMVKHSTKDMPEAKFSVLNSGKVMLDVIKNGAAGGFTNVNCSCCETKTGDVCKEAGKTCLNRKEFLYYDGQHLTEAANCYLAGKAFSSTNKNEVWPLNVKDLIKSK